MRNERSIGIVAHSPRTVRIALGDQSTEAGGAELQLAWMAQALRDRDWRVSLITPGAAAETGDLILAGEAAGLRVIPAYEPGGSGWRGYVGQTVPAYWRALRQADSAVYLHRGATGMAGWTALFCQLHGRRPVLSAASNLDVAPELESGEKRPSRLNRTLYAHFLQHCAAVLVQSPEQALLYAQRSGKQAHVVPNIAQVPDHPPAKASRPLVAWAGAIRACKRPLWVAEIARQLPEVDFELAGGPNPGEDDLWEDLQREAAGVPNLELLGWLPVAGVEDLIGRAWACLCTSQMEGFPNVYLMAWGAETPVVTSFSAGGLVEASGAGVVGNDAAQLAQAIAQLADDPRLREDMGRAGRGYVIRTHGQQVIGARLDTILSALVDGGVVRDGQQRGAWHPAGGS